MHYGTIGVDGVLHRVVSAPQGGERRARKLGVFALVALAIPDGGPIVQRINHRLAPGQDVNIGIVAPDGKNLYYVVTEPGYDAGRMYAVPTDGSHAAVPLTASLPPGRGFSSMQVSGDGQRIAYTADADTAGRDELFSVPTDGSQPPVKLSAPLPPSGAGVYGYFRFTTDSSRVVYLVQGQLYSVAADGSAAPAQLESAAFMGPFQIAADSGRVVYRGNGEIRSVLLDGSAPPLVLSGASGAAITLTDYKVSPDGSYVVYRAWTFNTSGSPFSWIYSAPVDGSAAAVLLFAPAFHGPFPSDPIFQVTPDSQRVVYRNQTFSASARMLQSAPIDGSAPAVRLDETGGYVAHDFRFASNGRVVFGYDPSGADPSGIYVVPWNGSALPLRITPTTAEPFPMKWEVSPFGRVVFVGLETGTYQVFSVPLDGSDDPLRLNPPMVAGGNVVDGNVLNTRSFTLDPQGTTIVYYADQDTNGVEEAYRVTIDGSTPAHKVNRPLASGGDVRGASFTPDSRSVIYFADQQEDDKAEVFLSLGDPVISGASGMTDGTPVHR